MKTNKTTKAFTLIELLVVISIIAVLAAILIPAVTGGIRRAKLLKMVSNGKQIYTAVYAADLEDLADVMFPTTAQRDNGDYTTSTDYFKIITTNGTMQVDFSFFSGPGTDVAKSVDEADFGSTNNAWNVVLDVTSNIDGYPFLLSRNYDDPDLPDPTDDYSGDVTENTLDFWKTDLVVVQRGGGAYSIKNTDWTEGRTINPVATGKTDVVLVP